MIKRNREYTKSDFKKVLELWATSSTQEIADVLSKNGTNCKPNQVTYIAGVIRKAGFKLPKKEIHGQSQKLAREVLEEMGLI